MSAESYGGLVDIDRRGAHTVMRLSGEVDAATVQRFRGEVPGVLPAVDLIDAGGVTFMSASGVSLVLAVQSRSRRVGRPGRIDRTTHHLEWLIALLDLRLEDGQITTCSPPRPSW